MFSAGQVKSMLVDFKEKIKSCVTLPSQNCHELYSLFAPIIFSLKFFYKPCLWGLAGKSCYSCRIYFQNGVSGYCHFSISSEIFVFPRSIYKQQPHCAPSHSFTHSHLYSVISSRFTISTIRYCLQNFIDIHFSTNIIIKDYIVHLWFSTRFTSSDVFKIFVPYFSFLPPRL